MPPVKNDLSGDLAILRHRYFALARYLHQCLTEKRLYWQILRHCHEYVVRQLVEAIPNESE